MCKTSVLAQKGAVIISQCCNCKVLNIWRSGVLMNFSFQQFDAFYLATCRIDFDDFLETRPDGQEVVILSTPFPDISLVFNRQEWDLFFEVMAEARFMKRIYELLNGN
ncbi:hypothetical protein ACFOG5_05880 [Pedobacter fastidiosus]|uniref:Uncharacterized protein n=1 Tax=Pedobacter fastidiosus TaxID=2765361 RepID=A0ABR7KQG7_9SPHI|nr:hypothetical protein [Pedobacter fastidiosus]MBC6110329.1 hypothetical protein [Pedobacter fastidiosus]